MYQSQIGEFRIVQWDRHIERVLVRVFLQPISNGANLLAIVVQPPRCQVFIQIMRPKRKCFGGYRYQLTLLPRRRARCFERRQAEQSPSHNLTNRQISQRNRRKRIVVMQWVGIDVLKKVNIDARNGLDIIIVGLGLSRLVRLPSSLIQFGSRFREERDGSVR